MSSMHIMDYWLHRMNAYARNDAMWSLIRKRAYAAAYDCGYLECDQ